MKKKWIIEINNIPSNTTTEKFIFNSTDIQNQINKFEKNFPLDSIEAKLNFDIAQLNRELPPAIEKFGAFNFQYQNRLSKCKSYQSTSLTWNSNAIDSLSNNPHQGAIGSSKYNEGNSAFYEAIETEKNTYGDTYSFKERTPISKTGSLKILLDSFQRTLVRSRISTIKANDKESLGLQYLWHQDESIFINLRVNIPISSNENYVIQLLDYKTAESEAEIKEFELVPGKAYIYNTKKYHRPFCKKLNSLDRINIICGVSPWFDFHPESNTWQSNEFYGELHPFEMFQQGHISCLIKS